MSTIVVLFDDDCCRWLSDLVAVTQLPHGTVVDTQYHHTQIPLRWDTDKLIIQTLFSTRGWEEYFCRNDEASGVVDFEGGSVTQDPLWLNFSLGPKEIEEQVADDPAGWKYDLNCTQTFQNRNE